MDTLEPINVLKKQASSGWSEEDGCFAHIGDEITVKTTPMAAYGMLVSFVAQNTPSYDVPTVDGYPPISKNDTVDALDKLLKDAGLWEQIIGSRMSISVEARKELVSPRSAA